MPWPPKSLLPHIHVILASFVTLFDLLNLIALLSSDSSAASKQLFPSLCSRSLPHFWFAAATTLPPDSYDEAAAFTVCPESKS